jgi:uncharacterized membrane protein YuzA (DUF378 family)
MNWGCAVTFNLLGIFVFDFLAFFVGFKETMGYFYLIFGLLIPALSTLAWFLDRK